MPSRLLCFFLVLFSFSALPAWAKPVVSGYHIDTDGDKTIFRLNVSDVMDFKVFPLENPTRLVVDIPDAAWRVAPAQRGQDNVGIVTRVRNGWPKPGITRVVLDLTVNPKIEDSYMRKPTKKGESHSLVVIMRGGKPKQEAKEEGFFSGLVPDLPMPTDVKKPEAVPTEQAWRTQHYEEKKPMRSGAELLNPPSSISTPTGKSKPVVQPVTPQQTKAEATPVPSVPHMNGWNNVPMPKSRPEFFTIVIDPGHGGVDPGAMSVSGIREKDLTMRYARQLKETLESSGRYRVVLTHAEDSYISLKGRVLKAQSAGGDLFISLHADSHPEPTMRGLSVYTLSEQASDKEAEALASSESKKDIIAGVDLSENSKEVTEVLIDLAQRDTKNTSARFAELVVNEIGTEAKLLRNTHRFAGFAVLKGIGVPSVLVEMGYLSNPDEEKLLISDDYRNRLVNAIARAVDTYCDQYTLRGDEEK